VCPTGSGQEHRSGIAEGAGRPCNRTSRVNARTGIGIHAAGSCKQSDGVAVEEGHLLDGDADFTASPDAARTLCFQNLAAQKSAHGNRDPVVSNDGVVGLEINRIAALSRAGVDAVPKDEWQARARRDDEFFAWWGRCVSISSSRSSRRQL